MNWINRLNYTEKCFHLVAFIQCIDFFQWSKYSPSCVTDCPVLSEVWSILPHMEQTIYPWNFLSIFKNQESVACLPLFKAVWLWVVLISVSTLFIHIESLHENLQTSLWSFHKLNHPFVTKCQPNNFYIRQLRLLVLIYSLFRQFNTCLLEFVLFTNDLSVVPQYHQKLILIYRRTFLE